MNDIINIKGVQWTHVVRPDIDLIQSIAASYDLHDLIIEDVNEARTQDKIDQYDDHLFLVLHFPKYDTDRNKYFSNEFNIILGKDFLISLASADTRHIDNIRHDYEEDIGEMDAEEVFKMTPYFVLYTMIDVMYDKTLIALQKFQKDITILEEKVFSERGLQTQLLEQLLIKRRNTVILAHMLQPQDEILEELHRLTQKLYEGSLDVYFEDLQYKLEKVLNAISLLNETTRSLSDTYTTLATVHTNKVVSALTIYTVVIGVMTLITGFRGMNVGLPGDGVGFMVRIILSLMILIGIVIARWARRKGWGL